MEATKWTVTTWGDTDLDGADRRIVEAFSDLGRIVTKTDILSRPVGGYLAEAWRRETRLFSFRKEEIGVFATLEEAIAAVESFDRRFLGVPAGDPRLGIA